MLRRFLVLLLALGLVVPALGATPAAAAVPDHCAAMAGITHHDGADHSAPMPAKHECVGCVAPFLDPAPQLNAPEMRDPLPVGTLISRLGSLDLVPAIPPPRG